MESGRAIELVLANVAGRACAAGGSSQMHQIRQADRVPSVLSGLFIRLCIAPFDKSFDSGQPGASNFELGSCDCVSARTLICGKVSAIARARHSVDKGCNPSVASRNELPCAFRSD